MAKNRLQLDFNLETTSERNAFVQEYLQTDMFKQKAPTEKELETISNYILFGKDDDGKSSVQKKEFEIKTKNNTWSKQKDGVESIEELMENPAFDENLFTPIGIEPPTKKKKETFSREAALREAPDDLKEEFTHLFRQIDDADLLINFYEFAHGKRKNPPRQELLDRFTEEEQQQVQKRSENLDSYSYLKWRHYLVELRSLQYTLRDSYRHPVLMETKHHVKTTEISLNFDGDTPIFPLGLMTDTLIGKGVFVTEQELEKREYTDEEFRKISAFFWEQDKLKNEKPKRYLDFSNPTHLHAIFAELPDLESERDEGAGSVGDLINTIHYYVDTAKLTDIQQDLLQMKIDQRKNLDIANFLNKKYGKSYTENYISTIYNQKILVKIAEAADFHRDLIENIYFPENFRYCTTCKKFMLKHPKNFVRKSRATDGYCGRCKECDKITRQKRKGN